MNSAKSDKIKILIAVLISVVSVVFMFLREDDFINWIFGAVSIACAFYAEEKLRKITKKKSFTDKVKEQIDYE